MKFKLQIYNRHRYVIQNSVLQAEERMKRIKNEN